MELLSPAFRTSSSPEQRFALRGAACSGVLAALVLFVNAAKRGGVIPTTHFTQLIAPIAEIFAVFLVIGLYARSWRRDRFSQIAVGINVAALSALVGVELVINLVFAQVPGMVVTDLREGPLGLALTLVSIAFLAGSILFAAALMRDAAMPRIPLVLYAVASVPIALRAFVPELVLDLGLAMLGVAVAWLSFWLLRVSRG